MVNQPLSSRRQPVATGRFAAVSLAVGVLFVAFFAVPERSLAADQLVAESITAGQQHSCAIRPSGQAVCWGDNLVGQLGDGTGRDRLVPTPVKGLADAKSISAGYRHTCAIRNSGQAVCWGRNEAGQLGNGPTSDRLVPTPVPGLTDAKFISAGETHTCAIRNSGQAVCWGINWYGKIGDGSSEEDVVKPPTPVQGLADATVISARFNHTCAVRASGQALCWGSNASGALGDDTDLDRYSPVPVTGLSDATTISAGAEFTCATRASGQALCWGVNEVGQLGNGGDLTSPTPTMVQGLNDAKSIATGYKFACAIRNSGQALCWGSNGSGELGNGTTNLGPNPTPVLVQGLDDAESIYAGNGHACAVRTSSLAVCWGYNEEGPLGDGTDFDRSVPTPVRAGVTVVGARITGLAVTPIRAKVKAGKKVTLRIKMRNTGGSTGRIVVKLRSTNRHVRVPASFRVNVPAGKSVTRKVTVKATRKARGQAKVAIKAAGRSISATIKVQRARRR